MGKGFRTSDSKIKQRDDAVRKLVKKHPKLEQLADTISKVEASIATLQELHKDKVMDHIRLKELSSFYLEALRVLLDNCISKAIPQQRQDYVIPLTTDWAARTFYKSDDLKLPSKKDIISQIEFIAYFVASKGVQNRAPKYLQTIIDDPHIEAKLFWALHVQNVCPNGGNQLPLHVFSDKLQEHYNDVYDYPDLPEFDRLINSLVAMQGQQARNMSFEGFKRLVYGFGPMNKLLHKAFCVVQCNGNMQPWFVGKVTRRQAFAFLKNRKFIIRYGSRLGSLVREDDETKTEIINEKRGYKMEVLRRKRTVYVYPQDVCEAMRIGWSASVFDSDLENWMCILQEPDEPLNIYDTFDEIDPEEGPDLNRDIVDPIPEQPEIVEQPKLPPRMATVAVHDHPKAAKKQKQKPPPLVRSFSVRLPAEEKREHPFEYDDQSLIDSLHSLPAPGNPKSDKHLLPDIEERKHDAGPPKQDQRQDLHPEDLQELEHLKALKDDLKIMRRQMFGPLQHNPKELAKLKADIAAFNKIIVEKEEALRNPQHTRLLKEYESKIKEVTKNERKDFKPEQIQQIDKLQNRYKIEDKDHKKILHKLGIYEDYKTKSDLLFFETERTKLEQQLINQQINRNFHKCTELQTEITRLSDMIRTLRRRAWPLEALQLADVNPNNPNAPKEDVEEKVPAPPLHDNAYDEANVAQQLPLHRPLREPQEDAQQGGQQGAQQGGQQPAQQGAPNPVQHGKQNPRPQSVLRAWTVEDLANNLERVSGQLASLATLNGGQSLMDFFFNIQVKEPHRRPMKSILEKVNLKAYPKKDMPSVLATCSIALHGYVDRFKAYELDGRQLLQYYKAPELVDVKDQPIVSAFVHTFNNLDVVKEEGANGVPDAEAAKADE